MTTEQRREVRGKLIEAGFERITNRMPYNPIYYDASQRGAYREIWQHKQDNTIITCDWDYKTPKS